MSRLVHRAKILSRSKLDVSCQLISAKVQELRLTPTGERWERGEPVVREEDVSVDAISS